MNATTTKAPHCGRPACGSENVSVVSVQLYRSALKKLRCADCSWESLPWAPRAARASRQAAAVLERGAERTLRARRRREEAERLRHERIRQLRWDLDL